jgi:prolyl oligopeptidase
MMRTLALVLLTAGVPLAQPGKPDYPPSRRENTVDRYHGVQVADPYRWLEDASNPEVEKWTAGQNALTRGLLDKAPGREPIQKRLEQLLAIGSVGVPVPAKGKYFYTRREGKQNQPILYMRQGIDGEDKVIVDPNALAADGTVALDWWFPSKDGKFLAYGTSKNGTEKSTLQIFDVTAGKNLTDSIPQTRACSLAWLPDSTGFYYTRYPMPGVVGVGDSNENYFRQVFFHKIGDDPGIDRPVFGGNRPREDWPTVRLSPDGRWLVVIVNQGWAKSEVYFQDTNRPESAFTPLVEGVQALFTVNPRNDRLLVTTNDGAPRYRLYAVDPSKPAREAWKELIPQGDDVLEGITPVGDFLVAEYMHKAASRVDVRDKDGKSLGAVELPVIGSTRFGANEGGIQGEADGAEAFFSFQSFTLAPRIYRLDPKTRQIAIWKQVDTDIKFDDYAVEQVTYRSKDKTEVSMFLAHKKDVKKDGMVPTLLTGYGGFNISRRPAFDPGLFVFLEAGGLFALPNLRGGGEYGEEWHKGGMLGNKQNVFDDFISAAKWLISDGWTKSEKLAITGGSNGGLLVGAALTQAPELFKCVICRVPLLDMIRYQKFLIARLWIPEYGTSDDPKQFRWLIEYSPYHKVAGGTSYPAVLLATAESDTRVDALHARKMTAALQNATAANAPILLRLEQKAGHGAGKPRAKVLEEQADVYSFLFWQLGMKPTTNP